MQERPRLLGLGICGLVVFSLTFATFHLILVLRASNPSRFTVISDSLPQFLTIRSPVYKGSTNAIPIAGVGVPNDHALLLMVDSLDFQVEHLLIIYSGLDEVLKTELEHLASSILPMVKETHLKQLHSKWLGVSETWNAVLRFSPSAPWYLILSLDVQFVPGSLKAFASIFVRHQAARPLPRFH